MFYDKIIRNRSDVNVGGKAFPKSLYPEDILSAKGMVHLRGGMSKRGCKIKGLPQCFALGGYRKQTSPSNYSGLNILY